MPWWSRFFGKGANQAAEPETNPDELNLQQVLLMLHKAGLRPAYMAQLLSSDAGPVDEETVLSWMAGSMTDYVPAIHHRPIADIVRALRILAERFGPAQALLTFNTKQNPLSGFTMARMVQEGMFDELDNVLEMVRARVGTYRSP